MNQNKRSSRNIDFYIPFIGNLDLELENVLRLHTKWGAGGWWCKQRRPDDPVAELKVKLCDIKKVFAFKSRSDKYPISSDAYQFIRDKNIEYFFFDECWPHEQLNLAKAVVRENPIIFKDQYGHYFPDTKMTIAIDFLRYLAKKMFNTAYATQLFRNEKFVLENIIDICDSKNTFQKKFAEQEEQQEEEETEGKEKKENKENKEKMDKRKEKKDIAKEIFRKIAEEDPERFSHIPDKNGYHYIPMRKNDTMCFSLTLHPAKRQHELAQQVAQQEPIEMRTYYIKIILV